MTMYAVLELVGMFFFSMLMTEYIRLVRQYCLTANTMLVVRVSSPFTAALLILCFLHFCRGVKTRPSQRGGAN